MAPQPPAAKPNQLFLRLASGLAMAVPALLCVWYGAPWIDLLVIVASVIMAWEWTKLLGLDFSRACHWTLIAGAPLLVAFCAASQQAEFLIGGALLLALLGWVAAPPARRAWSALGALYVVWPCGAFLFVRDSALGGREEMLWLLAVVWATDIFAYLVGRRVGGAKLWPSISPNKTWSGFLGGLVAGIVCGVGVVLSFELTSLLNGLGVSLLLSLATQSGDLLESSVKRRFGAKDASRLIPGHGGLLDRVDGLMVASVVFALLMAAFGGFSLNG